MIKQYSESNGVNTARFLKCVWSFFNIMDEGVKVQDCQFDFQICAF